MFDNLHVKYKIPASLAKVPLFDYEHATLDAGAIQAFFDYLASDKVKNYSGLKLDIYLLNTLHILSTKPDQIKKWMDLTVSQFDDKIDGAFALGSRLCLNEVGHVPVLNNMHAKPGYGSNYRYFACLTNKEPYLSVYKHDITEAFKYFSKQAFLDHVAHSFNDSNRSKILEAVFKDSKLSDFLYSPSTFKMLFTILEYNKEDAPDLEIERIHKYSQLLCHYLPEYKDIDSRIKATMFVFNTYLTSQLEDARNIGYQSSYLDEVESLLDLIAEHFKFNELDIDGRILDSFYDLDESASCIEAIALVEASLASDANDVDISEFNFDVS